MDWNHLEKDWNDPDQNKSKFQEIIVLSIAAVCSFETGILTFGVSDKWEKNYRGRASTQGT